MAVVAKVLMKRNLIRCERRSRLHLCSKMHRSRSTLQLADLGRCPSETIRGDVAFRKKLIKCPFALDQFGTQLLVSTFLARG